MRLFYLKLINFNKFNIIETISRFKGLIYRFKFLLISTLVCVAMTISFLILNNFHESQWMFDENKPVLNYTSAFLTGVYAMWNIYVSALMIFYAPSHKNKPSNEPIITGIYLFIYLVD